MDAAHLYMLSVERRFLGATSFPCIVGVMARVDYVLLLYTPVQRNVWMFDRMLLPWQMSPSPSSLETVSRHVV